MFAPTLYSKHHIATAEWEATIDHIKATVFRYDPSEHVEVKIDHEEFRSWLEQKGYLDWCIDNHHPTAGHLQDTGKYGYIEYIEQFLTEGILLQYLTEKNTFEDAA